MLQLAEQSYGPYQSASYLGGLSAVIVVIDLLILWSVRNGSRWDRVLSLVWPAAFFCLAASILVVNNA